MRGIIFSIFIIISNLGHATPRHFINNDHVEIIPIKVIDYDPYEAMYQDYEQVAGITRRTGKVFVSNPRSKS